MLRVGVILLLAMAVGLGLVWVNATKLPQWYTADSQLDANDPVAEFTRIIQKQGLQVFLKDKLLDLLAGKLRVNEEEFNALLLSSLAVDEQGRRLLSATEILKTQINQENIEIGAVINVTKLKTEHPDLGKKLSRLLMLPGLEKKQNVYLAVIGKPQAVDGELALGENIAVKIGDLSIPQPLLSVMGISIKQLHGQTLAITKLYIKDIELQKRHVDMVVSANF